jgi:hypothetical protein
LIGSFRVLNAMIPEEHRDWINYWDKWPGREVLAHPNYVKLFVRPGDQPLCAIWSSPEGMVLFPFTLRPLTIEPWAGILGDMCDLVTPYGYGGPFVHGRLSAENFWDEFDTWCSNNRVVSSFIRLSLFDEQILPIRGPVEEKAMNIVRKLNLDAGAVWMDYEHKVRKNVQKARRAGLVVERDEKGDRLDAFLEVYYSTMQRRQVSEQYYFPKTFFESIIHELEGQFSFFHVWQDQKLVSTELVLVSADHIYSFLGGTIEEAYNMRPNDLLKHEVIEWGTLQGKKTFVLGGGYKNGDGIFRYKKAFSPGGEMSFKVAARILMPDAYVQLCNLRREWEASKGNNWNSRKDYFPAYRS